MEVTKPSALKPEKKRTEFLDLPLELRCKIYRYRLVHTTPITVDQTVLVSLTYDSWDVCPCLFLVSKKVEAEASEVFYNDNIFSIGRFLNGGDCMKKRITEAKMQKIRKMEIILPSSGYLDDYKVDFALWSPIFANLTMVSIIAEQPLQSETLPAGGSFELEIEEWTQILSSVLILLARNLPRSCVIQVDDGDRKETTSLTKEYLPPGYQNVQTETGDIFFNRNNYSIKPEFWDEDDSGYDEFWDEDENDSGFDNFHDIWRSSYD